MLSDGIQPFVWKSHDPCILIEKNSGARGVMSMVIAERSDVMSGAQ